MKHVTPSNRTTRWAGACWGIAFLVGALVIGLSAGVLLLDHGSPILTAVIVGALVGTTVSLLFIIWTWRIWMWLSRGAPFQVGDQVVITGGLLKGEVGEVRKLCEGHPAVFIALARDPDTAELHYVEWDQLHRLGRGPNRQTHAP
jgi:protein-S-isoprenylcysteine O-methyltransferase Ste14